MKRPFECNFPDCDKKFTTRFSLRRHVATHQPAKQYVCVICYKRFALGQYLKEHTYIHTGQKPFKCPYQGCDKAFRQAGKLSMHKKFHQNQIFIVQKSKKRQEENNKKTEKAESCGCETKIEISLKNLIIREQSSTSLEEISHNTASCTPKSSENPFLESFSKKIEYQTLDEVNIQKLNAFTNSLQFPDMIFTRCLPTPQNIAQTNQTSFTQQQIPTFSQMNIASNQPFPQRLPVFF